MRKIETVGQLIEELQVFDPSFSLLADDGGTYYDIVGCLRDSEPDFDEYGERKDPLLLNQVIIKIH